MDKLSPISRLAKAGIGFDGSPLPGAQPIVPNEGKTTIRCEKKPSGLFTLLQRAWHRITSF